MTPRVIPFYNPSGMADQGRERRWQRLKQALEGEPFWRLLGITVDEIGDGYSRLRMPLSAQVRNFGTGPAHGGALGSLIDVAVGTALDSLDLPDMVGHTTVELSVSYLEPAAAPSIIAEGRILRVGRNIAVGEAEIREENGGLVAKGKATYMLFRRDR